MFPLLSTALRIAVAASPSPARLDWTRAIDERVLVVAPHPDDESLGCGGTIAQHVARGDHVTIAVVTDGGASTSATPAIRAAEAAAAARLLGGTWRFLNLAENHWTEMELVPQLSALLHETRASVVYTSSCIDYHPEHARVARALAAAFAQTASGAVVRVYQIGVPLTPLLVNLVADISATADVKSRALSAYRSQRATIAAIERLDAYDRVARGGPVEVFWQLDTRAYRRLADAGARVDSHAFRGVRVRNWNDPLCFVGGWRARRALRRHAAADVD